MLTIKNMNELLEKAIRDYPVGTKIKSVYKDVSHIVSKPISIRFENIYTFDEKGDIRCIYDKALNQWAEIINTNLLEKAKRNYPIGTKIKSLFNSTSHIITKTVFDHYGNIYTVDDNLNFICVYHKACNNWAEIINNKNMTQQEFNALRVGDFISNYEILHKYKEFLIVRCDDGHDLFDLNKINKLGLKIKLKKFMGLDIKKYDYVPCEVNDSALVYLCYVKEDGILFSNCKNGNIDNLKPKSIRIL